MSKIHYTPLQRQELEQNIYVEKCTSKQIRFTSSFKRELIEQSKQQTFYRDIFRNLWFPEYIVSSKVPERTYTRYTNIEKRHWLAWLIGAKKWRPQKEKIDIEKMTAQEKIIYLETKVAYLEELHKKVYGHYP